MLVKLRKLHTLWLRYYATTDTQEMEALFAEIDAFIVTWLREEEKKAFDKLMAKKIREEHDRG